ncbi:HEPN/Toprim-associated domain-containing protein [Comamonas endophytica]|uniref:HEPN/Toprim-associated domain-containing protein n=1 Tax=Comamonas endophytica TaxID=2949090 RepID=A0ABY6GGC8_9BURK|nr:MULTISPECIES: HEPN/Toprim-associated domain-containing protein [unclassified Acidovorax]MCD2514621.1 hypothetical protein [Acidovorax sp. D4N7]UYG54054.1 HEPN/Toprim-associated domain-containing protein [Acidovorax sp. 5MLIR]
MSTPITLTVGDIDLTYNTHHIGMDHGMLFQEADRQRRRHPYIDYEYCEQHQEDVTQNELCFCRSLGSMVSRLELLGYTLSAIKSEYETQAKQNNDLETDLAADDTFDKPNHFTFDQLVEFIRAHAVRDLNNESIDDYEAELAEGRGRFAGALTAARPDLKDYERDMRFHSERSHFGALIEFLDPYSTLRMLAENPANLDLEVVWDYGNFVDAGWAKNEDFVAGARRHQTYLIATEGSSDTHILKRGFALLRPDIEDFFRFIDIEERHPFSGTGNLAKFAEGLVKIDVHNRVVFLFDNDAEGIDAFRGLQRFNFPVNMRAMVLPDLDELRDFPAHGPSGVVSADINGRAAAIECYLDLRLKSRPAAQVRWTNYKESLGIYQGALNFKESYTKAFYEVSLEAIASGAYDASKLRAVLAALLGQCSEMATQMLYPSRAN